MRILRKIGNGLVTLGMTVVGIPYTAVLCVCGGCAVCMECVGEIEACGAPPERRRQHERDIEQAKGCLTCVGDACSCYWKAACEDDTCDANKEPSPSAAASQPARAAAAAFALAGPPPEPVATPSSAMQYSVPHHAAVAIVPGSAAITPAAASQPANAASQPANAASQSANASAQSLTEVEGEFNRAAGQLSAAAGAYGMFSRANSHSANEETSEPSLPPSYSSISR